MNEFNGLLVDWLIDCMNDWLIWLIPLNLFIWLNLFVKLFRFDWSDWSDGCDWVGSVGWLINWFFDFVDCLISVIWLIELIGWFDWLMIWLIDWLIGYSYWFSFVWLIAFGFIGLIDLGGCVLWLMCWFDWLIDSFVWLIALLLA